MEQLIKSYLAIFPDVTAEAAEGSVNSMIATIKEGNEPANPFAEGSDEFIKVSELISEIKKFVAEGSEGETEETKEEEAAEEAAEETKEA